MSSITSSANSMQSPRAAPRAQMHTRKVTTQVKKPMARTGTAAKTATARAAKQTPPVPSAAVASPFEIMAARIANRVAEMAENITFTEREKPQPQPQVAEHQEPAKKPPRKLEIRFPQQASDSVKFSAPFLDNTLSKMLSLQNRMLKTGSDLAAADLPEDVKREHFEQSAELSRIIALICAEKARQGA